MTGDAKTTPHGEQLSHPHQLAVPALENAIRSMSWVIRLGLVPFGLYLVFLLIAATLLGKGGAQIEHYLGMLPDGQLPARPGTLRYGTHSEFYLIASAINGVMGLVLLWICGVVFLPLRVAMTRVAAQDMEVPGGWFYLPFGEREFRALAVDMAYAIVILLMCLVVAVMVAFGMGMMTMFPFSIPPVFGWIVAIAVVIGSVWLLGRISMVMPGIVIWNDLDLLRPFQMTEGRAWRLGGSIVALSLLMALCFLGLVVVHGIVVGILNLVGGPAIILAELILLVVATGLSVLQFTIRPAWSGRAWLMIENGYLPVKSR